MQEQECAYVPSYRFVDTTQASCGPSKQSHAQRESTRLRRWQRRRELLESVTTVGQHPWTQQLPSLTTMEGPRTNSGQGPCSPLTNKGTLRTALVGAASESKHARAKRRSTSPKSPLYSPLLDVGIGGLDPFNAFVIPNSRKKLDELLTYRKLLAVL